MNTISQRTHRTLEFCFSNVLPIMSGNAIFRQMFFKIGLYLEMEIRINFYYEKQFQQMTPFPKQQIELYISASARIYKLSLQINFFSPLTFKRELFLKLKLA